MIHLHEVKQIHSFYFKSKELCKFKTQTKFSFGDQARFAWFKATKPHLLDSMFYSEFFNRNSIKFKPFAIERSFSTCAVIDDYYRCFKYITSITVIYTRILLGSRIGCAVRNKKIQLDGLKLCLLFFCTGYRKSSTVGIGVRDNFATVSENTEFHAEFSN